MDVAAYVRRIGYTGPLRPSADTLRALHVAHTMTVPFENLDIHVGRPISLEPSILYDKIVGAHRGGYCFELNGLFAWLLDSLGFAVDHLAARVLLGDTIIRPRSHRVLLVSLSNQRWIADVGFGGNGLIAPIALSPSQMDVQGMERFRLIRTAEHEYHLEWGLDERWQGLYRFRLESQFPVDYVHANYFLSHSPDSIFTRTRICTKPTTEGRLVLQDRRFKVRAHGRTRIETIERVDDYRCILEQRFGLSLSEDDLQTCFAGASAVVSGTTHEW
ncbi:N-hydroxyarylamine O-acetyltransferase [Nitrospira sp.]|nr:N-hydroxyarylamine O-acetyltransferase [Nitrospira sp.]